MAGAGADGAVDGAFASATGGFGAGVDNGVAGSGCTSTFGGALVSTVVTLFVSSVAGAGLGAGAVAVSTTGNVRVSNLRSGAFGMSRFSVVFSDCCGVLLRNIGTKMIASAISTAAPSRRCFRAESIGSFRRELCQL